MNYIKEKGLLSVIHVSVSFLRLLIPYFCLFPLISACIRGSLPAVNLQQGSKARPTMLNLANDMNRQSSQINKFTQTILRYDFFHEIMSFICNSQAHSDVHLGYHSIFVSALPTIIQTWCKQVTQCVSRSFS